MVLDCPETSPGHIGIIHSHFAFAGDDISMKRGEEGGGMSVLLVVLVVSVVPGHEQYNVDGLRDCSEIAHAC